MSNSSPSLRIYQILDPHTNTIRIDYYQTQVEHDNGSLKVEYIRFSADENTHCVFCVSSCNAISECVAVCGE